MAISGGDGSIILTTKVDTSGISKGSLSIRSALQGVDNTVKKVQNSFSAFREQRVTLQSLNEAIKIQQGTLDGLNSQYAKLVASGNMNSTQAQKLKAEIKAGTAAMKELQSAAQTLGAKGSASINRLGVAMKSLLSYFIGIQTIFKVINFSGEAAQFAIQTEASTQRLVDIYGEAAQSVGDFIDANARAIGMSKSAGASIAATYGNLLSVWADQATNAELTNALLNQTAVVASQTGRTTTDVAERIRSGLLGNTEAIEDLGINVNIKTIEITDAFKRIADGRSWEQLNAYEQSQVRTLAILEQSTKKYGTTVAQTSATVRNQYRAAYEDFKNTWGQVVNKVLIPVLNVLTQVFTIATKGLQIIAGLSGKTIEAPKITGGGGVSPVSAPSSGGVGSGGGSGKSEEEKAIEAEEKAIQKKIKALQKESAEEKRLGDEIDDLQKKLKLLRKESPEEKAASQEAKGIQDNIKALQKQNKQIQKNAKAKEKASQKEFASFDTIETLNFNQQSEEEKALEANEEQIDALQEQLDLVNDKKDALKETRQAEIEGIQEQIDARQESLDAIRNAEDAEIEALQEQLELLSEKKQALQDIASASGDDAGATGISGGVGGIGDLGLDYDNSFVEKISGDMAAIMAIVGGALVAVGLLLIFFGHIGWGIGFIIAGVSIFSVSMATLSKGDQVTPISEKLMKILAIAGTALVALGLILLFSGVWQWGIAFLVAGAAALGVAIVATKSGKVDKEAEEMLINVMAVAGAAMLVLGVILLCFGVVSGLSIGLVVAGAASLAGAIALNPQLVLQNVSNFLKDNAGLVVGISLALLVLGIILCVCGVVTPLSIGLIVVGATGLVAEIVLNWTAIKTSVSNFLEENQGLIVGISLALLVLGIILCCVGVITPLSIGLIVAGAVGLATEIALNWGNVKTSITNFLSENSGLIVGISLALLVLGIILCCVGVITPLSIGLIVVGATGLVTEVVLNWTAIKTSVSNFLEENQGLIVGISLALLVLGIILCCVGIVTPLSIGLIVVGATGLATEIALNWEYIKQSISAFITNNSGLIVGIAAALVVLGIILLFTGVGIPLAIGLIVAGGSILATEAVLNWNYITQSITEFITNNSGLIVGVSLALIVLGIILLFTGVGIPLAIGLIVAGGGALASEVDLNWNFIVDKVKEIWSKVKEFWNTHIAPIFTAKWWADLGKKALNGLIGVFEKGINFIIGKINAFVRGIDSVVSKVGDIFGADWSVATIPEVKIPRLAKGAVIPPNREFLAVLGDQKHGTNIEAPLQTIVDAFNIALQGNANYGGGNTEVVLEIDGREFGRAVVEQGNRENRRIGTRLVIA